MAEEKKLKMVGIGEPSVGKTSILVRFHDDKFSDEPEVTIGGNSWVTKTIDTSCGSVTITGCDTSGEERFRELTSSTYRSVEGFFVVFDLGDQGSFDEVPKWLAEVSSHTQKSVSEFPTVLIGNKSDLADRAVATADAKRVADEHGVPYIETSAKTGENINAAFVKLVELKFAPKEEQTPVATVKKTKDPTAGKKKDSGGGKGCGIL